MVRPILVFLFVIFWCGQLAAGPLNVYFLEAGEGESIYIEAPEGERLLIDTGNLITGYRVGKFLLRHGGPRLDYLLITHPHPDHLGGIFYIFQRFQVGEWGDNGEVLPLNEDLFRWYRNLFRRGRYRVLRAEERISLGIVELKVLWPKTLSGSWNQNSLVLLLTYGRIQFLFMGDVPGRVEATLLDMYPDLRADVLKVGHHGARDATTEAFLRQIQPKIAVVCVNQGNVRGYPAPEVLRRLHTFGARVFVTGKDGAILVSTDGQTLEVKSEK